MNNNSPGHNDLFAFPEPDQRLNRPSLLNYLAFLGPGMIVASATIGSGELFFASRGGAIFGYMLLWTFLLSVVLKGFAVYSGGRYILLTGEHPLTRWGQVFPGPRIGFHF